MNWYIFGTKIYLIVLWGALVQSVSDSAARYEVGGSNPQICDLGSNPGSCMM